MHELDVVELVKTVPGQDVAEWDAGTKGTVVAERPSHLLIEFVSDRGRTVDLISVPRTAVRAVWRYR